MIGPGLVESAPKGEAGVSFGGLGGNRRRGDLATLNALLEPVDQPFDEPRLAVGEALNLLAIERQLELTEDLP